MILVGAALLVWALGWWLNTRLARGDGRAARGLPPVVFGVTLLLVWELLVRGLGVPGVILPPPSAIGTQLVASADTLWADFIQTFVMGALTGYAIGCGAAFLTAILADRSAFFRAGILPVGNFVAALPIIGMAPIFVMWFGFGWQSKAAVVAVMCFFPMLVNTVQGFAATD
ncbi:MAG: ABC transporter permease subunit, partial [Pseudomonadota bacterium]